MNELDKFVDRSVLEQLSAAKVYHPKVELELPRFIGVDEIIRPEITTTYALNVTHYGQTPKQHNQPLGPDEVREFIENNTLPSGHTMKSWENYTEACYLDNESSIVYFTGESLALGALRSAIKKGTRLTCSGYSQTSSSGRHKTIAAYQEAERALTRELSLDQTSPEYEVKTTKGYYFLGTGEQRPVSSANTIIYINRPDMSQDEVDHEIARRLQSMNVTQNEQSPIVNQDTSISEAVEVTPDSLEALRRRLNSK